MVGLTPEVVRVLVDGDLDDQAVHALIEWYANLMRSVAAFPAGDLKRVEPPLRSTPGPHA